jgi:hypothetical protein
LHPGYGRAYQDSGRDPDDGDDWRGPVSHHSKLSSYEPKCTVCVLRDCRSLCFWFPLPSLRDPHTCSAQKRGSSTKRFATAVIVPGCAWGRLGCEFSRRVPRQCEVSGPRDVSRMRLHLHLYHWTCSLVFTLSTSQVAVKLQLQYVVSI